MAMILFIRISAAALSVYVFKQFVFYCCTERVKNKVNSFTARQLRGWDKITISGNQNDLFYLLFIGQRRDIDADLHIHALLLDVRHEIFFGKLGDIHLAGA